MFEENARFKESDGKMQRRDREQAVREHQRVSRALDGCRSCVDSKQMLKHLIVTLGYKVYLSLPSYKSLTEGHCLLAPTLHSPCATQLDEDVWAEMQTFRKALTKMFSDQGKDVVFFETARNLRNFPHMVMECVPLDQESGNLAPIYFKKAILECETEWSTNKKLVELAGKGVRRSIPKGLPYFAVCFGNDDGFGHVIEDEKQFPYNFAQETIGGILDLDHQLWRKKQNENFEQQRKKVLAFAKDWAPYDFTNKKRESPSSSSDSD
ncbi:hypothetical protein B566_EDAN015629 [Ephemera danica]|nr:hypothetical protein B566_EDAN015629 [Ephemera danica]